MTEVGNIILVCFVKDYLNQQEHLLNCWSLDWDFPKQRLRILVIVRYIIELNRIVV